MKQFLFITLSICFGFFAKAQGTETFTNLPAAASSYATRNWTGDNGLPWAATDARTDDMINGRAVIIRVGSITCNAIPNGIGNFTFTYQQKFTGSGGVLEVYINGILKGTFNPTTAIATVSINDINVSGAFNLEIKQTTATLRIAVDDVTWTSYSGLPCAAPSAAAGTPSFSATGTTSTTVNYAAATGASGYMLVRSTSSSLSATPVNATTYNEGDAFGGGTVVYNGTQTSYTDNDLVASTTYYYFVIAYNNSVCSGGPVYYTTTIPAASVTTTTPPVCAAPSGVISNLQLSPTSSTVSATFNAATGAGGYIVVQSTSATLGFTPVNGVTYTVGQAAGSGTVIKYGSGNTFLATGLSATTQYYFYVFGVDVFNCTGGPVYNTTAVSGNATTNATPASDWPATYYNYATGKSCAALKTALRFITDNTSSEFAGDTYTHNPQSYDDLWQQYKLTDIKPREVTNPSPGTSTNVIWDIYSDNPTGTDPYNFTPGTNQCGNYTGEGICYNREHSFPKSWFNDAAIMYSDYHHLFPTDGSVNGKRSNFKYGEVASATYTSQNGSKLGSSSFAGVTGPVFEPINEYKGDVARAYLYMVTRYEDLLPTWNTYTVSGGGPTEGAETFDGTVFPGVEVPYLKLMIKWHNQDPVSAKERARNNGAYSFQGNRNPFIDHPEYVDAVWNNTCPGLSTLPVDILTFGGMLNGNIVALKWDVSREINFDRYEIERSFNGTSYNKIGEVKATGLSSYNFNDDAKSIAGRRVYYRLKKVDKDGNYKYSAVFTLHIPLNTQFTVYPNPAAGFVKIQLSNNINTKVQIALTDVAGKVVLSTAQTSAAGLINLPLIGLSNGLYFIKMNISGEIFTQKITVVK